MRLQADGRLRFCLREHISIYLYYIFYLISYVLYIYIQGSMRLLADGRLWFSLRDGGGHLASSVWSRDADGNLVLNKCGSD